MTCCDEVPEGYWDALLEALRRMPPAQEDDSVEDPEPIL